MDSQKSASSYRDSAHRYVTQKECANTMNGGTSSYSFLCKSRLKRLKNKRPMLRCNHPDNEKNARVENADRETVLMLLMRG